MRAGLNILIFASLAATTLMMIPLTYHASHALAELDAARTTLRDLRLAKTPARRDTDQATARGRLIRHLRAAAADHDVRLQIPARPTDIGTVLVDPMEVTGSQAAILAFVDAVETGPRPVRVRQWRITPSRDGVRLSGEFVALARNWR